MKGYETIDISGDAGIRAFGKDMKDLFRNAAEGMYSLITEAETVMPRQSIELEVTAGSREALLVSWLNELVFHFDTSGFLGRDIKILEMDDTRLKASVTGEEFDLEKHDSGLLIKAATFHKMKIEWKEDHWETEIVFDI